MSPTRMRVESVNRVIFIPVETFACCVAAICGIWRLTDDLTVRPDTGLVSISDLNLDSMFTSDHERPASDRLCIGEYLVVLSSREVHPPDARRVQRLTPKSIGVLLALVRQAGQVVSRDQLLDEVWPDTMPTNDVVTQAITQLRKAFSAGDAAGESTVYIETISKTGYRLLAPVTWQEDAVPTDTAVVVPAGVAAADQPLLPQPAPASAPTVTVISTPRARGRHRVLRRYLLTAIGLFLLCSTLLMSWLLWQYRQNGAAAPAAARGASQPVTRVQGSPERPYRLITSTVDFETLPALSPDGAVVVFAKEADGRSTLWRQATENGRAEPLLETPDDASDRFATWSPDGRHIAFARFRPQGRCEVLVVPAEGGSLHQATRCDGSEMLRFDWTPDGRGLIFGTMTGSHANRGIRTLDLGTGRWTSLSYAMTSDDFDFAPRYSPDGKQIGFVRNPQVGDLWVMDADGGNVRRLTDEAAEIRGWSWLGRNEMVFGQRVDSESRLYRLDVATRQLRDMGLDDAESPSVARHMGSLAFVRNEPKLGLFRIPLDGKGGEAQRLFPSAGRDGQPLVAPDGKQIAFTSDRSGSFALWTAQMEDPGSLRMIEGLRPDTRQPMDWSPSSSRLLVIARNETGVPGIYEVSPETGGWAELPAPVAEPLQAIYGPRPGTVLVVERTDNERMVLSLFDRMQTPWKRLASMDGVSQVRLDRARDRLLFTQLSSPGLWQIATSLAPASQRPLNREVPTRWRYRTWAVASNGEVEYLHVGPRCMSQLTVIEGKGASQCLDERNFSSANGMSLAPDDSAVFISLAMADGTDIGLMPVQAAPSPPLIGTAKWLSRLNK